jgi:hypothetical protein
MSIALKKLVRVQGEGNGSAAFEYVSTNDTLSAPGNGESITIPDGVNNESVTLEVTGGSGRVQFTNDPLANVLDDTAVFQDWDSGNVATDTSAAFFPVTALRQVNVSGVTKLKIRAQ